MEWKQIKFLDAIFDDSKRKASFACKQHFFSVENNIYKKAKIKVMSCHYTDSLSLSLGG